MPNNDELIPDSLKPDSFFWDPGDMKGGYVTATLRREGYTKWFGRINERNADAAFGLAMPFLGSGMIVFQELDRLEVVHAADNYDSPVPAWKVEKCMNFRQDVDKGEIFVTARVMPALVSDYVQPRLLTAVKTAAAESRSRIVRTLRNNQCRLEPVIQWRPGDDDVTEALVTATLEFSPRHKDFRGRINEQPFGVDFQLVQRDSDHFDIHARYDAHSSTARRWGVGEVVLFYRVAQTNLYDVAFFVERLDKSETLAALAPVLYNAMDLVSRGGVNELHVSPLPDDWIEVDSVRLAPGDRLVIENVDGKKHRQISSKCVREQRNQCTSIIPAPLAQLANSATMLQQSKIAAASIGGSRFHQFVQSQVNQMFGGSGTARTVSFSPANAPGINFRLTPEGNFLEQMEMFVKWLADGSRYPQGSYVTADEAAKFFAEFVRVALQVKTQEGLDRRIHRAMVQIAPMISLSGDMRLVEAIVSEQLRGIALDVCMDGPPAEFASAPAKDKSVLMRTAAANVIQERIDVQSSYANRSPEHKTRMEIYQAMKQKIEAIDPGGLE